MPENKNHNVIPSGQTRAVCPIPATSEGYPREFRWDEATATLHVGDGTFAPVSRAVWEFEISGFRPVRSWLGYRMKEPTGKKSSPLDEIRPDMWPAQYTEELLELLWVLEHTLNMSKELNLFFNSVLQSDIMASKVLPQPTEEQRKPPEISQSNSIIPSEQLSFDKE